MIMNSRRDADKITEPHDKLMEMPLMVYRSSRGDLPRTHGTNKGRPTNNVSKAGQLSATTAIFSRRLFPVHEVDILD